MNQLDKVRPKFFSVISLAFFVLLISSVSTAKEVESFNYQLPLADTIPQIKTSPLLKDTNTISLQRRTSGDTIIVPKVDTLNIRFSKDTLDGPVSYSAEDSMVLDVTTKKITLYGKEAKTTYQDNELTAPLIEFDQESGYVTASLKRDSLGKVTSMANFKQGEFQSQSDSIRFNIKSGKGITKGTYTQQGEMYVHAETIKKFNDDVFFAQRARFTTCDLDTPHFAFVSNRVKFINQKMAITGPVHPEFEGVPVPVYVPFGLYPLSQGRQSGILAPQFTANE